MDSVEEQKEEAVNHCERRDFAGSLGSRPCDPWSFFFFSLSLHSALSVRRPGKVSRSLSPRSQPQELTDRFSMMNALWAGLQKCGSPIFSLSSLWSFQRRGGKDVHDNGA